jgi:glycosyltransferase involved in cell wall biosynthesis
MRIALVHSEYRLNRPSGENTAVRNLYDALLNSDHEVFYIGKSSPEKAGIGFKTSRFVSVSLGKGFSPDRLLRDIRPDVVHVHNLFPNIGSNWLYKWRVKTIGTIHNYRNLCANGILFRDGSRCVQCIERGPFHAVRNSCYKGNPIANLPFYLNSKVEVATGRTINHFSSLIFLNPRALDLHKPYLLAHQKTYVMPNIVQTQFKYQDQQLRKPYIVYAGALSPEKGILNLIENWDPKGIQLYVFGSGPLEVEIASRLNRNVKLMGLQNRDTLMSAIQDSEGVIIPSLCDEMLPNIYVESLSLGKRVIAHKNSIIADLMVEQGTGTSFGKFSEVSQVVEDFVDDGPSISDRCLQTFQQKYHQKSILKQLLSIYESINA